jgi:predicted aspartyl protease
MGVVVRRNGLATGTIILGICAVFLASPASAVHEARPLPTIGDLRDAAGYDRFASSGACVSLRGEATIAGADAIYEHIFLPVGAFREITGGPRPTLVASDGSRVLQQDAGGAPFNLDFLMRESSLFLAKFSNGTWLAPGAGISYGRFRRLRSDFVVPAKLEGGLLQVQVRVNGESLLVDQIDMSTFLGKYSVEYFDYKPVEGLMVPHRIELTNPDGRKDETRIRNVSSQACTVKSLMRVDALRDAHFDDTRPSELKVRILGTGHLMVKPLVNGKDVGWFIFDSGAGGTAITPQAADSAGLKIVGEAFLAGAGTAITPSKLRGASKFELGRMTVDDLVFLEMDIGGALPALRDVAGIVGWDVLIRARVEIELDVPRLSLHDPSKPIQPGVPWQPLSLHTKTPHVRGHLGGGVEGIFLLDTGAANNSIVLHSPTVEKYGLIPETASSSSTFRGAGGFSRYVSGEVARIEVGGHTFKNLGVRFSQDPSGAMADPYTLGNVGILILDDFRLVFDYPNERIAMIKR